MVDKKLKSTKWNSKEKSCLKCGIHSNWHSHRSHCWSAHQICGKCSEKVIKLIKEPQYSHFRLNQ